MNTLILNRDTFRMPEDGWYQIAPLGEFAHSQAGVVQVVDREACEGMANRFGEESRVPNFAGLLVDFDHFSLDGEKRSEAAGWITALEARIPRAEGGKLKPEGGKGTTDYAENTDGDHTDGLYAKIRWSDLGEEAVKGGRYRFLSPVWSRGDCQDLGNGRLRPVRLLNAAVTNDPNLKGMVPLSNRGGERSMLNVQRSRLNGGVLNRKIGTRLRQGYVGQEDGKEVTGLTGGDERFMWVLGDSPGGRHCPGCAALAGQVHTMDEWSAAGLEPGGGGTYCGEHCRCSLMPTDEPISGDLEAGRPRRRKGAGMKNRGDAGRVRERERLLANIGWTDEARAASIAVRQAKARTRREALERGEGSDHEYETDRLTDVIEGYRRAAEEAFREEHGYLPTTPEEIAEAEGLAGVPEEYRTGGTKTPAELAEEIMGPEPEPGAGDGAGGGAADGKGGGKDDPWATDDLGWFEDEGLSAMSREAVERLKEKVRDKLRRGQPLEPGEEGFLEELARSGDSGVSDGDPIFQWHEQQGMGGDGPEGAGNDGGGGEETDPWGGFIPPMPPQAAHDGRYYMPPPLPTPPAPPEGERTQPKVGRPPKSPDLPRRPGRPGTPVPTPPDRVPLFAGDDAAASARDRARESVEDDKRRRRASGR